MTDRGSFSVEITLPDTFVQLRHKLMKLMTDAAALWLATTTRGEGNCVRLDVYIMTILRDV